MKWWDSPYINHFIQPDTIIPNAANPQNWNGYSYVSNNPLRYSDPTGHMQASDDYQDSDGKCAKGDKGCNDLVKRIELKKEKKEKGWFHDLMRDPNTPIVMATVQEITASIGEVAIIATVFQPELAPVSAIVFTASWIVGRVASTAGTAATTIQYQENLNGMNKTDMLVSWGTTIAGLNPEWSFVSSTVNFLYTAERTAGW